jgi:hypothetical protein
MIHQAIMICDRSLNIFVRPVLVDMVHRVRVIRMMLNMRVRITVTGMGLFLMLWHKISY